MSPDKSYWHNFVGFNYRMTNIQAAIGVAQIDRVSQLLLKEKKIFENYNKLLSRTKNIILLPSNKWSEFLLALHNNFKER